MEQGPSPPSRSPGVPALPPSRSPGVPALPPSRLPESPEDPYGGPVPPGGWHGPVPTAPVPGRLAGWWSRAGAALVDGVIVALPGVVLTLGIVALLAGPVGATSIDDHETGVVVGILVAILSLLLVAAAVVTTALVYAPLTMRRTGSRNGQTWGKQLFGIRVARMSREPHTFASAATREVVVKFLLFGLVGGSLAWIPTVLDLLWPLWDGESRALHDMLVDTRVIRA